MGHFVAGEEMGHFVAGTICHMGRKWDILSSGTICRPKSADGTICRWDKMSPNLKPQQVLSRHLHTQGSHQSSLLDGSESVSQSVSQLVTSITNDRTRVR